MNELIDNLNYYIQSFLTYEELKNLKMSNKYHNNLITKSDTSLQYYKDSFCNYLYTNIVFDTMEDNYAIESSNISKQKCWNINNKMFNFLFSYLDETIKYLYITLTKKELYILLKYLHEYYFLLDFMGTQSFDLCKKCYNNLTCKRVKKLLKSIDSSIILGMFMCDFCNKQIANNCTIFSYKFSNDRSNLSLFFGDDVPLMLGTKKDLKFSEDLLNLTLKYDEKFSH